MVLLGGVLTLSAAPRERGAAGRFRALVGGLRRARRRAPGLVRGFRILSVERGGRSAPAAVSLLAFSKRPRSKGPPAALVLVLILDAHEASAERGPRRSGAVRWHWAFWSYVGGPLPLPRGRARAARRGGGRGSAYSSCKFADYLLFSAHVLNARAPRPGRCGRGRSAPAQGGRLRASRPRLRGSPAQRGS